MSRLLTSTAVAALIAGIAAAAASTRAAGYCSQGWSVIDTDQDGAVSAAEFEAATAGDFAAMDADGDGMVSREEFIACHASAEPPPPFDAGNGPLEFAAADRDGSGDVSAGEYRQAAYEARLESGVTGASALGTGEAADLEPSAGGDTAGAVAGLPSYDESAARASRHFHHLDADGDGSVSEEEWAAGGGPTSPAIHERRFDAIDADGDGSLTEAEFTAARTVQRDAARQDAEAAGEDTRVGIPVHFYRFHAL